MIYLWKVVIFHSYVSITRGCIFLFFLCVLQELAVAEGNKQERQCLWRCVKRAGRHVLRGGKPTRNGLEMSLGRLDVVGPDICVCPCFKKGERFWTGRPTPWDSWRTPNFVEYKIQSPLQYFFHLDAELHPGELPFFTSINWSSFFHFELDNSSPWPAGSFSVSPTQSRGDSLVSNGSGSKLINRNP
jgi:hypothetical protein